MVNSGGVNVLFGTAAGLSGSGSQFITQDTPGVGSAAETDDVFGLALAAADFTSDDFADLAIGVPARPAASAAVGAVNVLPGTAAGLTGAGSQSSPRAARAWAPESTTTRSASRWPPADSTTTCSPIWRWASRSSRSAALVDAGEVDALPGSATVFTGGGQAFSQESAGVAGSAEEFDMFGFALAATGPEGATVAAVPAHGTPAATARLADLAELERTEGDFDETALGSRHGDGARRLDGARDRTGAGRDVLHRTVRQHLRADLPDVRQRAYSDPFRATRIGEYLQGRGIRAGFFLINQFAKDYPGIVSTLRQQGHWVLNHSYSHPDLTAISPSRVSWEIRRGVYSNRLRPPYGAYNSTVSTIASTLGYRICNWTIHTLDWQKPDGTNYRSSASIRSLVRTRRPRPRSTGSSWGTCTQTSPPRRRSAASSATCRRRATRSAGTPAWLGASPVPAGLLTRTRTVAAYCQTTHDHGDDEQLQQPVAGVDRAPVSMACSRGSSRRSRARTGTRSTAPAPAAGRRPQSWISAYAEAKPATTPAMIRPRPSSAATCHGCQLPAGRGGVARPRPACSPSTA